MLGSTCILPFLMHDHEYLRGHNRLDECYSKLYIPDKSDNKAVAGGPVWFQLHH